MNEPSQQWIDEVHWDTASDGQHAPPPGVIRINGQPIPIVEFDLTPSGQIWTSPES